MSKEARARIRINELLQRAGWRFFDDENGSANIVLEANVKLTKKTLDDLGADFEEAANGFVDYLLLDDGSFSVVVLEAKSEKLDPLIGKEKARQYGKIASGSYSSRRPRYECELPLRGGQCPIFQNTSVLVQSRARGLSRRL